jgi:hypothetical protein
VSRAVREGGGSKGSCNAKELSLEDLEVMLLGAQNEYARLHGLELRIYDYICLYGLGLLVVGFEFPHV